MVHAMYDLSYELERFIQMETRPIFLAVSFSSDSTTWWATIYPLRWLDNYGGVVLSTYRVSHRARRMPYTLGFCRYHGYSCSHTILPNWYVSLSNRQKVTIQFERNFELY